MQFQDRLLIQMFQGMFNNVPNSNGKDDGRAFKFVVFIFCILLLLLLLVGSETVKIIFRKKMAGSELSFFRIFLSLIVYGGFAWMYLKNYPALSEINFFNWYSLKEFSIIGAGVFYLLLAPAILIAGIYNMIYARNHKIPEYYPGESKIFNSANKPLVRNLYEPGVFFVIGGIVALMNPFWGVPLLCCSISYWLTLVVEYSIGIEAKRNGFVYIRPEDDNYTSTFETIVS